MAIWEGIGGTVFKSVLGSAAGNIAKQLVSTIGSKLNPTDVEKALKAGIQAAVDYDEKLPLEQHLFFRCEPDFIPGFLADVFNDAGVQEELARPLAKQEQPQVAYLVEAFKKIAQEHPKVKGKLNESLIEPWLKVLADTYFERTGTYLRFKIAQKVYLKQLASRFDDVKFAGVAVEGQEIDKSALLEKIFVMPDVREEMPAQQWLLESALESALENRQAELLWEQRQRARREANLPAGRTFSAQQLLRESQSHKVVLLGDPGTGKTTLMSYFAVMLAAGQPEKLGFSAETDLLPILILIRDWARLLDSAGLLDYIKIFAEKNLSVPNLPAGFFEYWLEDGRALILLDGLDEVADTGRRYTAVEQIESFLGQFSQNRAVITSRPAGYRRDFFRTDEFPHFTLQLFDDTKIQQFIDNWYSSRISDPEEAKRRKDSLKQALEGGERIKLLARNPLLLTIIALIHRYEAYLPRQRYKLYDRAVKTLLTAWDDGKEMRHCPLEYLNRDDLERLMQRLAYWIHAQGGTGDKEGGTLIDREELIQKLGEFIADETGVKRYQAEGEAKRFVEYIRERTGLLNEQGQDCYAFAHKTFQEYLAGEEILYQQRDDSDVVLEHIRKYLHNAHWREVLLLVIAQQTSKGATKALQEILRQPTPYEPWLHRNLLFAGICLTEDFKVADASLVEEILRRLVDLEIQDDRRVGWTIRSQVFKILCGLNETKLEDQALQLLKDSAERMDEVRLLEYRAALGEKEEVIATLLSRLQDEDSRVRFSAVQALGQLRNASERVIEALLSRLREDENSRVRVNAAAALGELGNASEPVIEALLNQLQDEDSLVLFHAARALVKLGKTPSEIAPAVAEWIERHQDSTQVGDGINALWDLVTGEDSIYSNRQ
ncbi:NACHT domain-containing protein [Kamptonema formosum]|uniref:NACHT domain-containing protein n=1 Tax=Kamptonema formosum TaxID=331992 RepID=UPI000349C56A|nr:HEAT repeat domain-containing protein [Oscillatoria sp. PCC 10802]